MFISWSSMIGRSQNTLIGKLRKRRMFKSGEIVLVAPDGAASTQKGKVLENRGATLLVEVDGQIHEVTPDQCKKQMLFG